MVIILNNQSNVILSCGYSYHVKPLHIRVLSGLPSYLIRLQTEGVSQVLVDGKMSEVVKGDLLIYSPGTPYELRIDKQRSGKLLSGDYFLFCQGEWIMEWWGRHKRKTRNPIQLDENILSLWRQIILEKRKINDENSELLSYLLRSLLIQLDRSITETTTLEVNTYRALQMKRYIEEHATQKIKVEQVASHIRLSVSRAVHLFKEVYGITMVQYSMEIRLSMAVERMRYSHLTLEQIALTCGFGNYSYFHRAFTSQYGVSPRIYREKEQIQLRSL